MPDFLRRMLLLGCCLVLLTGCDQHAPLASRPLTNIEGRTMATFYNVKIAESLPESESQLKQQMDALLEQANNDISTYRPNSVLSRFNHYQGTEPQLITDDMAHLIMHAQEITRASHGAMDISVGPLVNLWGFGPDQRPIKVPDAAQISAARERIGLQHIKLINNDKGAWLQKDLPSMYLDLSSLGESYGAEVLSRFLLSKGITNFLVSVGNTVSCRGVNGEGQPWRVAIRTPTDNEMKVQERVNLSGYTISTSGSYLNYYEVDGKRYSHLIDPATGAPITHRLVSATVIASSPMEGAGWDVSLMVLGPEKAMQMATERGMAVYLISKTDQGFSVTMTPQFKAFISKAN
jgi:thiamine biosynthesis lipoprotein